MVRSAPPQNESLPEVTTAPLMAASLATLSTICANSAVTEPSITFIERPAMSQVRSAMPSESMSSLKLLMGFSPILLLSFRGARAASEPGIQKLAYASHLDSEFAHSARPGMTG